VRRLWLIVVVALAAAGGPGIAGAPAAPKNRCAGADAVSKAGEEQAARDAYAQLLLAEPDLPARATRSRS
jgi:hypothetical protein